MPKNIEAFGRPQVFFAPDKLARKGARTPDNPPEKQIDPIDLIVAESDIHKQVIDGARSVLDATIELPVRQAAVEWGTIFDQVFVVDDKKVTGQQLLTGRSITLGSEKISLWEALKKEARKNHQIPDPQKPPIRGNRTAR